MGAGGGGVWGCNCDKKGGEGETDDQRHHDATTHHRGRRVANVTSSHQKIKNRKKGRSTVQKVAGPSGAAQPPIRPNLNPLDETPADE